MERIPSLNIRMRRKYVYWWKLCCYLQDIFMIIAIYIHHGDMDIQYWDIYFTSFLMLAWLYTCVFVITIPIIIQHSYIAECYI